MRSEANRLLAVASYIMDQQETGIIFFQLSYFPDMSTYTCFDLLDFVKEKMYNQNCSNCIYIAEYYKPVV